MWCPQIPRILLAAFSVVAFAQSPIRIAGVEEPPELTGEPKKFTPPSEAMKQFAEALPKDDKNLEQVKAARDTLTNLLQENPNYSDGFMMRALFNRCMLNSEDAKDILMDINMAISIHAKQTFPGAYESLADHYSFRAKVEFDTGQYEGAMNDLEVAMKQKIDNAQAIFNSGGTKPEIASENICNWSLSDLDTLVRKSPKDYRVFLFRGLYYKFLVPFDEDSSNQAFARLQNCRLAESKIAPPALLHGYSIWNDCFSETYKSLRQRAARVTERGDPTLHKSYPVGRPVPASLRMAIK
jgi:tetratricopeptide (TPR) repeat protein